MTWYPISYLPPQYEDANGAPYSGAVLKAYKAGTSTPISMATDYLGASTAASFSLNSSGYPISSGNAVIIPHVQENFKLALYPNQSSADANSGALWSYDNIQIAESTNSSFFQSFSGDGSTTAFTLSENLGTDEKTVMVFVSEPVKEHSTNGGFSTDTDWTKGAGWTIGSGVATASGAISTAISQNSSVSLVAGEAYAVTYTITRTAGGLIPSIGGQNGTERTASGTYREVIVAGSTQTLAFTGNGFTGTLDNVSITPVNPLGFEIKNPSAYTLSETTLTFAIAPRTGTNNILVFAPILLVGAVGGLADAAAISEANAAASATASASSATLAGNWATKTTGNVDGSDYSAKAYAIGGTGVTNGVGAAKEWATKTSGTVDGSEFSAKYWAQFAGGVTVPDASITNAKLANMPENSVKVNATGSSATPTDLSLPASTFLGRGSSGNLQAIDISNGFRNRIINGGMICNNYGTVNCINGSYMGGAERWINVTSATSVTAGTVLAEAETSASSGYCQHINGLSTTGTSFIGIKTRLENTSVADLNSKTITISGKVIQDTGSTQILSLFVQKPNALNNWGAQTQVASSTVDVPTGTVTPFSWTLTLGASDATNGLGFDMLYNGISAVTNKNFHFEDIQLEIGSVATPFEMRPKAIEQLACYRYLPAFVAQVNGEPFASGMCYSTTAARLYYKFPVTPRAPITGITTAAVGNFAVYDNTSTLKTATALTFIQAGVDGCDMDVTVASGLVAGNGTIARTLGATAYILFTGAEL